MITLLALVVVGYLLGSIPTGYWLVKALKGTDVRQTGSGSTGATNVLRAAGRGAAAFVLLVDVAKGWLPVWLAIQLDSVLGTALLQRQQASLPAYPMPESIELWYFASPYAGLTPPLVATAALIGHSKSIFLRFTGGKSAATGLGTLIALEPLAAALTFVWWCATLAVTRFVSIASISAGWVCAVLMALFHAPLAYVGYCVAGAAFVTFRHKSNIERLLAGVEPRLGEDKRQESAATDESTAQAGATTGQGGQAAPPSGSGEGGGQ